MSREREGRPSIPGPGRSVARATEQKAQPIRQAALIIEQQLAKRKSCGTTYHSLYASRWSATQAPQQSADGNVVHRAAWALLATWLIGRLGNALPHGSGIVEAQEWFWGTRFHVASSLTKFLDCAHSDLQRLLARIECDEDLADLLPYILDPIGPASRLDVINNPALAKARSTRRAKGIFYTPSDVAEFIAEKLISELHEISSLPRILDPACGSGVFLRAALAKLESHFSDNEIDRFDLAVRTLYGIDENPQAIEAATYVLLHDVLDAAIRKGLEPWMAWHLVRRNLACTNAITLHAPQVPAATTLAKWHKQGSLLTNRELPEPQSPTHTKSITPKQDLIGDELGSWAAITDWFPEVGQGFDVLLANPPYARLTGIDDWNALSIEYRSHSGEQNSSDDLYPLFVEMSWRYARVDRALAGMVVPLSLAYQRSAQLRNCRKAIMQSTESCQFMFFDREPHALFGEEVKTRNAIFFAKRGTSDLAPPRPKIHVTSLLKWTSRTRHTLFSKVVFTDLGTHDITEGIPKLGFPSLTKTYAALRTRKKFLRESWAQSSMVPPSRIFDHPAVPTVYVASTAYNFLNVLRPHESPLEEDAQISTNPVHSLVFSDETLATAAFAVLSSRTAYWWWHVHCDGFHVPLWFLETIPFSLQDFSAYQLSELARLGGQLWDSMQHAPIISVNRGRVSVAYRPFRPSNLRDGIDLLLFDAAQIDAGFLVDLQSFVANQVVVDDSDKRRLETHSYVATPERLCT